MIYKIINSIFAGKVPVFNKLRFPGFYQKGVGMNARKMLHDNSKELVDVLIKTKIINEIVNVFELGAGPCRNLFYLNNANPNLKLICNDLNKRASFKYMDDKIKSKIKFYQMDSLKMISDNQLNDIDLFLSSDHLMHIDYKKADKILEILHNKWMPKYIMLRERRKEYETPNHPRLYHNYEKLLVNYKLLYNKHSDQDEKYFIWLLKIKK